MFLEFHLHVLWCSSNKWYLMENLIQSETDKAQGGSVGSTVASQ